MKPLLERKRRARINRCLDELKELMVFALESEGESMAKLEKADLARPHRDPLRVTPLINAVPTRSVDLPHQR